MTRTSRRRPIVLALMLLTGSALPLSLSRAGYPHDGLASGGAPGRPFKRLPLRAVGLKGVPSVSRPATLRRQEPEVGREASSPPRRLSDSPLDPCRRISTSIRPPATVPLRC